MWWGGIPEKLQVVGDTVMFTWLPPLGLTVVQHLGEPRLLPKRPFLFR